MPGSDLLLSAGFQTGQSVAQLLPQSVEKQGNTGNGESFFRILGSQSGSATTTSLQGNHKIALNPQGAVEGQELPASGNILPAAFQLSGFLAVRLSSGLSSIEQSVFSAEFLPEGVIAEETTDILDANTALLANNGQIIDETSVDTIQPDTASDTPASVQTEQGIINPLPDASSKGQQTAVDNILKDVGKNVSSGVTGNSASFSESARDVAARMAALTGQQEQAATQKVMEEIAELDIDTLVKDAMIGKKAIEAEQASSTDMRSAVASLVTQSGSEPAQSLSQPQINGSAMGISQNNGGTSNPFTLNSQAGYIDLPLKHQGWDNAFGQRVVWQVNQQIQKADIRLNPPHLGPIEVKVNMTEDGANITFHAQHGAVRDAVEASLPRLREMLEGQGINLANVDVSEQSIAQHHQQQAQGDNDNASGSAKYASSNTNAGQGEVIVSAINTSNRLLDAFA